MSQDCITAERRQPRIVLFIGKPLQVATLHPARPVHTVYLAAAACSIVAMTGQLNARPGLALHVIVPLMIVPAPDDCACCEVKWEDPANPNKGIKYLYLTHADYWHLTAERPAFAM